MNPPAEHAHKIVRKNGPSGPIRYGITADLPHMVRIGNSRQFSHFPRLAGRDPPR
jgi:hypothetical protein